MTNKKSEKNLECELAFVTFFIGDFSLVIGYLSLRWFKGGSIGFDKRSEAVFLQLLLHRIRLRPGFKSANFQKVEPIVGAGRLNDVIITLRLEDRSLRFYLPFVFESPDLNGIPARVGRLGRFSCGARSGSRRRFLILHQVLGVQLPRRMDLLVPIQLLLDSLLRPWLGRS